MAIPSAFWPKHGECPSARSTRAAQFIQLANQMGSKAEAKALMAEAGVPVLDRLDPDGITDADLPVLIKASAGGGGRGIRRVDRPDDLLTALKTAMAEAEASFGIADVYVEKLIENATAKLKRKGCDWIVANDVSPSSGVMGGDSNTVHLISADKSDVKVDSWPVMTKHEVATALIERIADTMESNP